MVEINDDLDQVGYQHKLLNSLCHLPFNSVCYVACIFIDTRDTISDEEKSTMSDARINLLDFKDPKIKTLHITWFAFFLTFVVWFSHAPMLAVIKEAFDLTSQQVKALMILNVAMTIPARIIIGIMVDKFGPRHVQWITGHIRWYLLTLRHGQLLRTTRTISLLTGLCGCRLCDWYSHGR